MSEAENLYETTRDFLTPEAVKRFSLALDEPTEKIHLGLQEVVPTLLDRIINEGSTSEGAERIFNLMEGETHDDILPDIFGNNYHSIASSLMPSTGMNAKNVEKLMEMAAPAVLGVIGSKIKDDLNAENLNDFLKGQKYLHPQFEDKKKLPYLLYVAGLMMIVGVSLWYLRRSTLPVSYLQREIASIEKEYTPIDMMKATNGLSLKDLTTFLATATSLDLPKRFSINTISFSPGTTDMRTGGESEFEIITTSMKRYPKSTVKIEAYVEDTGDSDENLLLSENRAMLVREELIGRGIEPSRVKAEGRGPKSGYQLYFVLTGL